MSTVVVFLERLLQHGEAVMHDPPIFPVEERASIEQLLESEYSQYCGEVAGPRLPFDRETAGAAAQFLSLACWLLVSEEQSAAQVFPKLHVPSAATPPETHLSADLTLRFLASVLRRARMRPQDDPLVETVVAVLRRWPLSGVLAPIDDPPLGDLQFQNHHGVQLLYAERLADNLRPSWVPAGGRTREVVELVLQQRGQNIPIPEGVDA